MTTSNLIKKRLRKRLASDISNYLRYDSEISDDFVYYDSMTDYCKENDEILFNYFNSLPKKIQQRILKELDMTEDDVDEFTLIQKTQDYIDNNNEFPPGLEKVEPKLEPLYYQATHDFQNCVCYAEMELCELTVKMNEEAEQNVNDFCKQFDIHGKKENEIEEAMESFLKNKYGDKYDILIKSFACDLTEYIIKEKS